MSPEDNEKYALAAIIKAQKDIAFAMSEAQKLNDIRIFKDLDTKHYGSVHKILSHLEHALNMIDAVTDSYIVDPEKEYDDEE